MDVEASEFAIVSRMLAMGLLCRVDFLGVEFHDEHKFLDLITAAKAPHNFARVLKYVREQAGDDCKSELVDLGLRADAY